MKDPLRKGPCTSLQTSERSLHRKTDPKVSFIESNMYECIDPLMLLLLAECGHIVNKTGEINQLINEILVHTGLLKVQVFLFVLHYY